MNDKTARKLGIAQNLALSSGEYLQTSSKILDLAVSGETAESQIYSNLNDSIISSYEILEQNSVPVSNRIDKYSEQAPRLQELFESSPFRSTESSSTSNSSSVGLTTSTGSIPNSQIQEEWPAPCEFFNPTLLAVDSYRFTESSGNQLTPGLSGEGVHFYNLLNSLKSGTGDFAKVPFIHDTNVKFAFQITGNSGEPTGLKFASGKVFYYENEPFPSGNFSYDTNTYSSLSISLVNNQSGRLFFRKALFGFDYFLQMKRSMSDTVPWTDYTGTGPAAQNWVVSQDQNNVPQGFVNEEWIFRFADIGSPAYFRMGSETVQRKEVGCFDYASSGNGENMVLRFYVEPDLVFVVANNPDSTDDTASWFAQIGTAPCQGEQLAAYEPIPVPKKQVVSAYHGETIVYNLLGENVPVNEEYFAEEPIE